MLPSTANNAFFLAAVRNEDAEFEFVDGSDPIVTTFTSLKMVTDTETEFCLSAKYDPASAVFGMNLNESDCNSNAGIVCRAWKNVAPDCSIPFKKQVKQVFASHLKTVQKTKSIDQFKAVKSSYYTIKNSSINLVHHLKQVKPV